jgi:signal transduction histidine kinase
VQYSGDVLSGRSPISSSDTNADKSTQAIEMRPRKWDARRLSGLKPLVTRKTERKARLIDPSARKEGEEKLNAVRGNLEQLARHLQDVAETERARIARDIHDELGSSMAGIRLHIMALVSAYRNNSPTVPDIGERLYGSLDNIEKAIDRIVEGLRPQVLDHLGLPAALKQLAADFRKIHNVEVAMTVTPDNLNPPSQVGIALYRIAQECLNNIAKHARARHVQISLHTRDRNLVLEISDDGIGPPPREHRRAGHGIAGMRQRAAQLGGALEIRHAEPGMRVRVNLPEGTWTATP